MYRILILLFLSLNLSAQIIPPAEPIEEENPKEEQEEKPVLFEEPKPAWRQRMHWGGNFWLGLYGSLYVDASPMIGFDVSEKNTVVGLGGSLIYNGQPRNSFNGDQSGSLSYGGRLFLRQGIWKSIFAQAEFEIMNSDKINFYPIDPKANDPGYLAPTGKKLGGLPLIGAGFYQNRSWQQKGSFVSIMYSLGGQNFGYINPQSFNLNGSVLVMRLGVFI
jgi:hypothetical protein